MKAYLMRLICAAFICAAVRALAGEGRRLVQLSCGLFLVFAVLSVPVDPELVSVKPEKLLREAEDTAREGAELARAAREEIITEALEAYIIEKAASVGLELQVRVILSEDQTPDTVTLTGRTSAGARQQLTRILTRELGLVEEDVIWIEPHQSSA